MAVARWISGTALGCCLALGACSAGSDGKPVAHPDRLDRRQQVAQVRELAQHILDAGTAPGVVVVLRHDDRTTVVTAGLADVAAGRRMTARDRFRIASLTKSMVATVVLQLDDEGVLGLEDTVGQHLPGLLAHGDGITVHQLLDHTSGLPDYFDLPALEPTFAHPPVRQRPLVVAAGEAEPWHEPGAGQSYSNSNYATLGLLVEKVTGRSLADVLDARIFEPLGMRSASLRPRRVRQPPFAHGYAEGKDVTDNDLTVAWAAGGVVADAEDVSRFFDALFGGDLVPDEAVDLMAEPARASPLFAWSGYGLGIGEISTPCGPAYGNDGTWWGFHSAAYTRRETGDSVVLLMNGEQDTHGGWAGDLLDVALCG